MAEGRTAYDVEEDGWYVEEPWVTPWLLAREYFNGNIWDPAAGAGNIVLGCLADGKGAIGSDLRDRVTRDGVKPPWFVRRQDFLAWPTHGLMLGASNIITNPPYGRAKLAEAFIRHSLAMPGLLKAAFFVNSKFIFGAGRAKGLFTDHAPDRIYPVWPRPSCPPGQHLEAGGKAEGGVQDYAWLVWDLAAPTGRTEFIWAGGRGGAPSPRRDAPARDTAVSGLERRLPPRTGPRPRRKS